MLQSITSLSLWTVLEREEKKENLPQVNSARSSGKKSETSASKSSAKQQRKEKPPSPGPLGMQPTIEKLQPVQRQEKSRATEKQSVASELQSVKPLPPISKDLEVEVGKAGPRTGPTQSSKACVIL